MKRQFCIPVDVEFKTSGAFSHPIGKHPVGTDSVTCPVGDSRGGLELILRTLEEHELQGVFFVETLNTCYFGDSPMGTIARQIYDRGHDVEMHLHPCWVAFLRPDWRTAVQLSAPRDSLAELEDRELEILLEMGLEVFSRWHLPKPCAFRAGNLEADGRIYPVLKRLGVPLSSNVGLGVRWPEDRTLQLAGGRHWMDGILELPVASYRELSFGAYNRWKTFTVIGTGGSEAEELLKAASMSNTGPLIVLTHPGEYVKKLSDDYQSLRFNELARKRLQRLCLFLRNHRDRFDVTTFCRELSLWTSSAGTDNPDWRVTPLAIAKRLIENNIGAF